MDQLKPCPLCKEGAVLRKNPRGDMYWIECGMNPSHCQLRAEIAALKALAEKAENDAIARRYEHAHTGMQTKFLEMQERAEKAEAERDVLAAEVMRRMPQSDYDSCPYDGEHGCLHPTELPCRRSIEGVKVCWLEWAAQEAAERGEGR